MAPCNRISTRPLVEHDCATWPEHLRQLWLAQFDPDDAFTDKPWGRATQYQTAGVVTRYFACCRLNGLAPAVTPAGLRAFIRACEAADNAPTTIEGYAWQLSNFVSLVLPEDHERYAWLRATCMRLKKVAARAPRRRAVHGVRSHEFDMLGQTLIAEARACARQDLWSTTERHRTGLFLRLGALDPERLKALGGLTRNQIDLEMLLIRFPADAQKTPEESLRALPADLAADIREWIDGHLERWAPDHDHFWIAKGGKPASLAALAAAMRRGRYFISAGPTAPTDSAMRRPRS